MKVIASSPTTFMLVAETPHDHQLVEALNMHTHARMLRPVFRQGATGAVAGCTLEVDSTTNHAQLAQASRELASALRKLFGLSLGEAADHGHVGAPAANPKPQEELSARLVELKVMVQALCSEVGQVELMLKEMVRAHAGSGTGEAAIVATDIGKSA